MSEHTPGPWRDGQEGNLRVYGPDGMGEHSGLIAVVYKGKGNARLIAAAPDLLDALQFLLTAYSEPDSAICCNGHECGCRGATVRDIAEDRAREAMAKAGVPL